MRLRVELPSDCPEPEQVQVLIDRDAMESAVCVWWDAGLSGQGTLEGYNCEPVSIEPLSAGSISSTTSPSQWTAVAAGRPYGLRLQLRYLGEPGHDHPDRSILTVRCPGRAFSFLVFPVANGSGEAMHAPDLGLHIWPACLGDTPPPFRAEGETIYDRVRTHREQSFRGAMSAMPPRRPLYFILGWEGNRQKFRLNPDGDLHLPRNFIDRVPANDTPRLRGDGAASFRFGFEDWLRNIPFHRGWLPPDHPCRLDEGRAACRADRLRRAGVFISLGRP